MTKDNIEIVYWSASFLLLCITAYYVADAPIRAVKIGRKLNDEQQHNNAKRHLFLTLFGLRGSPVHADFVMALNRIDIVFHDNPQVIEAWRKLHYSMGIKGQTNPAEEWNLLRVALLSEMANVLGYPEIKQVDMVRHYYPIGHENREIDDYKLKKNAIDYLEKGAEIFDLMIEGSLAQKEEKKNEAEKPQTDEKKEP